MALNQALFAHSHLQVVHNDYKALQNSWNVIPVYGSSDSGNTCLESVKCLQKINTTTTAEKNQQKKKRT